MTDEQIVKALECCKIGECAKCVPNNNGKSCRDNLIDLASDLINRKNAEIKEKDIEIDILIKKKDTAYDEVANLMAEVEELKKGFTADADYFASEYDSKIKSEAIKEFAEKLKEKIYSQVVRKKIDYTVEEMVGD